MFVVWSSLYHIPIKHRDLIKELSHLRPMFLKGPSYMLLPLATVRKLVRALATNNWLFLETFATLHWSELELHMEFFLLGIKERWTWQHWFLMFLGFKMSIGLEVFNIWVSQSSYGALEIRFVVVVVNFIFLSCIPRDCHLRHNFIPLVRFFNQRNKCDKWAKKYDVQFSTIPSLFSHYVYTWLPFFSFLQLVCT